MHRRHSIEVDLAIALAFAGCMQMLSRARDQAACFRLPVNRSEYLCGDTVPLQQIDYSIVSRLRPLGLRQWLDLRCAGVVVDLRVMRQEAQPRYVLTALV